MDKQVLRKAFEEKLNRNYADAMQKWSEMNLSDLIENAAEIAATKMIVKELPEVASIEDMEYLIQFEDPLEIVSNGWMLTDDLDHTDELQFTLGSITCSRSADHCYPRDADCSPPERGQTMC